MTSFPTPVIQTGTPAKPARATHAGRLVADKKPRSPKRQESGGTFQNIGLPFPIPFSKEEQVQPF